MTTGALSRRRARALAGRLGQRRTTLRAARWEGVSGSGRPDNRGILFAQLQPATDSSLITLGSGVDACGVSGKESFGLSSRVGDEYSHSLRVGPAPLNLSDEIDCAIGVGEAEKTSSSIVQVLSPSSECGNSMIAEVGGASSAPGGGH